MRCFASQGEQYFKPISCLETAFRSQHSQSNNWYNHITAVIWVSSARNATVIWMVFDGASRSFMLTESFLTKMRVYYAELTGG
jgi:hypothetical protein